MKMSLTATQNSHKQLKTIFSSPSYMMPILQDVDLIKIVKVGISENKFLWLMSYDSQTCPWVHLQPQLASQVSCNLIS